MPDLTSLLIKPGVLSVFTACFASGQATNSSGVTGSMHRPRTYNIPVATHNVMGPVATIASANCAAAMQDFLGHETFDFKNGNRAGEGDLILYDREIVKDGHIQLSDKPGLGVEVNRDFASKYLMDGETWWG